MTTICSASFECCLPIHLGEEGNKAETPKSPEETKSQHDMFWDKKCDMSPTSPGCKIYDS